jgi:transcriptional regulator with XRE-family HTH domain
MDTDTLSNRLRTSRRKVGLTQEKLADLAGTNQAVVQKIENGRSNFPRKIREIASALNVNPGWLLFGEGESNNIADELKEVKAAVVEAFGRVPVAHGGMLAVSVARYKKLVNALNKVLSGE